MDIQKVYSELMKTAKPSKTSVKNVTAVTLKPSELEAKQLEILKQIAKISKQKNREFNLIDVFYKGMEYKNKEGISKVALSNGFRYKGVTKTGKEFLGVWRID